MLCAMTVGEKVIWNAFVIRRRKTQIRNLANQEDLTNKNSKLIRKTFFFHEEGVDYIVFKIERCNEIAKPFFVEGFKNGNRFKMIIDTDSPVTIFALDEIKKSQ